MCVRIVAWLPQAQWLLTSKINVFWKISFTTELRIPFKPPLKKFQKTLILAFEANSALSQIYTFFLVLAHCAEMIFCQWCNWYLVRCNSLKFLSSTLDGVNCKSRLQQSPCVGIRKKAPFTWSRFLKGRHT